MLNNKLIIANWKLNPQTAKEAVDLAKKIDSENSVICPPFPFLGAVLKIIKKSKLGAQNVFWEDKGAYTGEVSAAMLKSFGVEYVITGHSERRRHLGETDEMISKKIKAALENDLIPILCIGETLEQRKAGKVEEVIENQIKKDLERILNLKSKILNLVMAYEPVWAIGTGIPCEPEEAARIHRFIRETLNAKLYTLNPKIIYGGSVDSKNIEGFLKYNEIEGALVGGASINAEEFQKILKIANKMAG